MALATELAATVDHVRSLVPDDIFAAIGRSIGDLEATGLAARAANLGSRIDLPVLPRLGGGTVDLAAIAAGGPLVLVFYRGGWCPYCNVALRAYQRLQPDLARRGATLVAVTPELDANAATTASGNEVAFDILLDRNNGFARSLGLVFALPEDLRPLYGQIGIDLARHNGDESHELPIPATYVLDQGGVVRWAFVESDFTKRAEPADVLAALDRLVVAA